MRDTASVVLENMTECDDESDGDTYAVVGVSPAAAVVGSATGVEAAALEAAPEPEPEPEPDPPVEVPQLPVGARAFWLFLVTSSPGLGYSTAPPSTVVQPLPTFATKICGREL